MNIVKELRKKKGIQQKELALIIGVAQPTVSDWENGKKDPSDERLRKLAEYFGVDELFILGKGVTDLTQPNQPKTREARIVSHGLDNMPSDVRQRALAMFQLAFPIYFDEGENSNDA